MWPANRPGADVDGACGKGGARIGAAEGGILFLDLVKALLVFLMVSWKPGSKDIYIFESACETIRRSSKITAPSKYFTNARTSGLAKNSSSATCTLFDFRNCLGN